MLSIPMNTENIKAVKLAKSMARVWISASGGCDHCGATWNFLQTVSVISLTMSQRRAMVLSFESN